MILGALIEGARALALRPVRWERLETGALRLALLAVLPVLLTVLVQRSYSGEGAGFVWTGMSSCGLALAVLAWTSYAARERAADAPSAAQLLALMLAQLLWAELLGEAILAVLARTGWLDQLSDNAYRAVWHAPLVLPVVAQMVVLARARSGGFWRSALVAGAIVLAGYLVPASTWWQEPDDQSAQPEPFALTQDMLETQLTLLDEQAEALKPQRPGVVDMYTITFAPYEGQEVFRNESAMVAEVMAQRFDAAGRGLQLINHRATVEQLPLATPQNLQRAIEAVAGVMDKNEDVLFIHLTSHGAGNGELAAQFDPFKVDPVMPADLRKWLDDAGIRYRVLSISACFAGNWIKPLSSDDTLVMTASDADHTSYGCGSKSDLTFFGRAMYDEQIRSTTLSFEAAHAAARKIILQRENEAGKDDGYSNPQIAVGRAIVPVLARERAQRSAEALAPLASQAN